MINKDLNEILKYIYHELDLTPQTIELTKRITDLKLKYEDIIVLSKKKIKEKLINEAVVKDIDAAGVPCTAVIEELSYTSKHAMQTYILMKAYNWREIIEDLKNHTAEALIYKLEEDLGTTEK